MQRAEQPGERVPVRFDSTGDAATIRLEGDVGINCAAALRQHLMEALSSDRNANHATRISLAEISAIDITAVQLLWAAERESRRSGQPLSAVDAWPAAVVELLHGTGFSALPFSAGAA
jgi:ABC-type transporter Mla MlaB component